MKSRTGWGPDTCDCFIEIEYESENENDPGTATKMLRGFRALRDIEIRPPGRVPYIIPVLQRFICNADISQEMVDEWLRDSSCEEIFCPHHSGTAEEILVVLKKENIVRSLGHGKLMEDPRYGEKIKVRLDDGTDKDVIRFKEGKNVMWAMTPERKVEFKFIGFSAQEKTEAIEFLGTIPQIQGGYTTR